MSALQDIRYALRLLRRAPTVSAIAILSTAFSVAATAVVFAAIKAVLIDPLPYARPSELVQIRTEFVNSDASQNAGDFAFWNDAQEIGKRTRTLQSVGVFGNSLANLAGDNLTPPEALYGLRVSAGLFPTLGVHPCWDGTFFPKRTSSGTQKS